MSRRNANALMGLLTLATIGVIGFLIHLYLGGHFRPGFETAAMFDRSGQLLRDGSDVKMRGVLVGEVARVEVTETGEARVVMLILPDQPIPDNVGAAIRAKTLFGEKFVDLLPPEEPADRRFSRGDVIPLERTIEPLEVETILAQLVPLLRAVDPENFAAAMAALVRGFSGNEEALRRATLQAERALTETERTLPHLERNLVHLRNFAAALDQADTDLLLALDGLERVGQVIRRRPAELQRTLTSVTGLSRDLADLLIARDHELGILASDGREVLERVAARAPEVPDIAVKLDGFVARMMASFSQGPFWRILMMLMPGDEAPYPPGEEPQPRASAQRQELLRALNGDAAVPEQSGGLLDLMLAPVDDETLDRVVGRLEQLGGRTP